MEKCYLHHRSQKLYRIGGEKAIPLVQFENYIKAANIGCGFVRTMHCNPIALIFDWKYNAFLA
jgi:hypothetical protein